MVSSREIIRKLEYNPRTGVITWRKIPEVDGVSRRYNTIYSGKVAGSLQKSSGYWVIGVGGKTLIAHRIAWFLYYGEWPKFTVDHKNLIKIDNKITNLRDFDMGQQARNKPISCSNKSGTTGVHYCKSHGQWVARIHENGIREWLGYFDSKEDAVTARLSSQNSKDFYESHGKEIPVSA